MTAGPTRTLQVAFDGTGTGQSSNFTVATARHLTQSDGSPILAGASPSRAANLTMSGADGNVTQEPGTLTTDGQGLRRASKSTQNYHDGSAVVPDTAYERPGGGGAGQYYAYGQTLGATTAAATLGQTRQSGTFTGFAAGIMVRTLEAATQDDIAENAQLRRHPAHQRGERRGLPVGAGGYSMSTVRGFFGPVANGSPLELAGSLALSGPGDVAGAGIFQTRR